MSLHTKKYLVSEAKLDMGCFHLCATHCVCFVPTYQSLKVYVKDVFVPWSLEYQNLHPSSINKNISV